MKRYIHPSTDNTELQDILCMSNIRGRKVQIPHKLPFSFYFSGKNRSHGIRVKPIFNPDSMISNKAGNLELHGDWKYTPGKDDKRVSEHAIQLMKQFFRTYLVLFAAVWDFQLPDTTVQDYFEGEISLQDLVSDLDFYRDYKQELNNITTIEELEDFCREYNLVNLHGND